MSNINVRHKGDISAVNQLDLSDLKTFLYFTNELYDGFKSSEYYFTVLLRQLLEKHEVVFTLENHYHLKVQLAKDIAKNCQIDMAIQTPETMLLVELKKNIDNIEKDLFKWFLLTKKRLPNTKKIQLVWEKKNKSKDKSGKPNQYKQLLMFAKREKWIDDYFYFTPERFTVEIQKLELFLTSGS